MYQLWQQLLCIRASPRLFSFQNIIARNEKNKKARKRKAPRPRCKTNRRAVAKLIHTAAPCSFAEEQNTSPEN